MNICCCYIDISEWEIIRLLSSCHNQESFIKNLWLISSCNKNTFVSQYSLFLDAAKYLSEGQGVGNKTTGFVLVGFCLG